MASAVDNELLSLQKALNLVEELSALKPVMEASISELQKVSGQHAGKTSLADVRTTEDDQLSTFDDSLAQLVFVSDSCSKYAAVKNGVSVYYKKRRQTNIFDFIPDFEVEKTPKNTLPFEFWTVKVCLSGWALKDILPSDVLEHIKKSLLPLKGPVYVLIFGGINDVRSVFY